MNPRTHVFIFRVFDSLLMGKCHVHIQRTGDFSYNTAEFFIWFYVCCYFGR